MSQEVATALSMELMEAEKECKPIGPLTERYPGMTVADAYAIQSATIQAKLRSGARTIGKKIGLTSKAMQQLLGVNEPDYGQLLDNMLVQEDEGIAVCGLCQPKAEGEIAFILKKNLEGPGLTCASVLRATEAVVPAIEIVDSRIKDWRIRLQDTIADNASSALLVTGGRMVSARDLDLRVTGMVMQKNGAILGTAAGAAVLGNPAFAVAWLGNKLAEFGLTLGEGEVVLSGALTAAVPVTAGDCVHAVFDRLGHVSTRFTR